MFSKAVTLFCLRSYPLGISCGWHVVMSHIIIYKNRRIVLFETSKKSLLDSPNVRFKWNPCPTMYVGGSGDACSQISISAEGSFNREKSLRSHASWGMLTWRCQRGCLIWWRGDIETVRGCSTEVVALLDVMLRNWRWAHVHLSLDGLTRPITPWRRCCLHRFKTGWRWHRGAVIGRLWYTLGSFLGYLSALEGSSSTLDMC